MSKKENLLQFSNTEKLDVITLQETQNASLTLQRYNIRIADGKTRTAILTQKHLTAQQRIQHKIEHTFVEILTDKDTPQGLFVINICSPPNDSLADFDKLLREVKKKMWAACTMVVQGWGKQRSW